MKLFGPSPAYYGNVPDQTALFAGGSQSNLVPDTFNVSLNGRNYMIDLSQPFYRQYHRQIAPLLRTQADTSKTPGEQSLDPNGLWRRSFEDWSAGAGQRYQDRDSSVPNGFWQSKGIDALTDRWQISLLPDTAAQRSSANTNLAVVACNGRVYVADGQTLAYTTGLSGTVTWTTVTGTPAVAISSICTDGFTVYAAYGASGVYTTDSNTSTASQYVTAAVGSSAVVGYVNDRLMLGNSGTGGDGKLYNIVASGALPTALFAPNNANATWVGFAEGDNQLYAAVNIGLKAYVYGTTTNTDGTALTAPTVQGALPLGEKVTAIFGYLDQLIIGSNLGVRWAAITSGGGISLGALITGQTPGVTYGPTTAVQALCGYGRWVWFGWADYDTTSTGLGRLDLENFAVAGVQPAFASDLMATAQGAVTGAANLDGTVIFAVSGTGFYVQSADLVASGQVTSGYILYDLADTKVAALLDVQTPGPLIYGQYAAYLSADGGTFTGIGLHTPGEPEPVTFGIAGTAAVRFEVQMVLDRDTDFPADGPAVTRYTLRVWPAPRRPVTWQLPIILDEEVVNASGSQEPLDPIIELEALEQMAAAGRPVAYQEGDQSYQVLVVDCEFLPDQLTEDKHYFNGIALVSLEGIPVPN